MHILWVESGSGEGEADLEWLSQEAAMAEEESFWHCLSNELADIGTIHRGYRSRQFDGFRHDDRSLYHLLR